MKGLPSYMKGVVSLLNQFGILQSTPIREPSVLVDTSVQNLTLIPFRKAIHFNRTMGERSGGNEVRRATTSLPPRFTRCQPRHLHKLVVHIHTLFCLLPRKKARARAPFSHLCSTSSGVPRPPLPPPLAISRGSSWVNPLHLVGSLILPHLHNTNPRSLFLSAIPSSSCFHIASVPLSSPSPSHDCSFSLCYPFFLLFSASPSSTALFKIEDSYSISTITISYHFLSLSLLSSVWLSLIIADVYPPLSDSQSTSMISSFRNRRKERDDYKLGQHMG
ncbi:hypothetical protein QVD17_28452 [Tagetes erecta]|uniref:Uncharacterized protein n=1 Tax=Tagetes erecta TaxID=13708 RepID=A0AAD8KAG1_TARER|nr:hypothetical protein QVD17_28452 [Tagetes erecta]